MHYPLIRLIASDKLKQGKPLESYKTTSYEIFNCADQEIIDYIEDYTDILPVKTITDLYDGGIFELVEEDKSGANSHVIRTTPYAMTFFSDNKIMYIAKKAAELTSENFRTKFPDFIDSLIERFDMYISDVSYGVTVPFDEWLLKYMRENTEYRIIQVFDLHI